MPIETNQFFFGNSLVNYSEGGAETNVPYWLSELTLASGGTYSVNGGFGFLRQFADRDTPSNEWGFNGVSADWDSDTASFQDIDFTQIIITPGNFIQQTSPDTDYPGDTVSPLDATETLLANVLPLQPDAQIFVYEGWADLAEFSEAFPPSDSTMERYYAHNQESYHDWYVDYVTELNTSFPEAEITLIPVAPVLSGLLAEDGPLSEIATTDLFVDSAPHGTETTYFLASLITYQATNGEPAPADFQIPDNIDPLVVQNFTEVLDFIEVETTSYIEAAGGTIVPTDPDDEVDLVEPEPEPVDPEPTPEPVEPEPTPEPVEPEPTPEPVEPEPTPEPVEPEPDEDDDLLWRGTPVENGVTIADLQAAEALYCTADQIAAADLFYSAPTDTGLGFPTVPMSRSMEEANGPYQDDEDSADSAPLSASLKTMLTDIL
ncbi:hypothetical protein [Lentibacter sp.]|uniref:hypothetical protein n=1 Tax=Lentibacter sp. TaxID=2024994 RepID=UPI003F6B7D3B